MSGELRIPKKLIEVALPLDDINAASIREKSIRHGHPSTLHLWWARRPLAAARAVIFAQMVNDPGYQREIGFGINKRDAEEKREKLFEIIRELVKWENTSNEEVLDRARDAIAESWRETCALNRNHPDAHSLFDPERMPMFHDPFAGGGALPLEAQRLGLESFASDLNPVAVMINKSMIEIPEVFSGVSPVGPLSEQDSQQNLLSDWSGAKGLAEDIRRYGNKIKEKAFEKIGHLYPRILITEDIATKRPDLKPYVGVELKVVAWLWARTVKSPNPAYSSSDVPLVSSYLLSSKKHKEAYVETVIDDQNFRFEVKLGVPPQDAASGTKLGRGANFKCIFSDTPIPPNYIYEQSQSGLLDQRLMAIVAEGDKGRVYLSPNLDHEYVAANAQPDWSPMVPLPENPRWFSPPMYGMKTYGSLFTKRQLLSLNTFSDLVLELRNEVINDAKTSGMKDDGLPLRDGGSGATAYGDAITIFLTFAINKLADRGSTICSWDSSRSSTRNTFGRQAIPMTWDFAEPNPFSDSTGNFLGGIEWAANVISLMNPKSKGHAFQSDAARQKFSERKVVSTDPPYYDNIGYADLSDYFYVWMRRTLKEVYPELFSTMAVPKAEELVATPYRHGGKDKAENFFLNGMTQAMQNIAQQAHLSFPVTIYYAFKQSETREKNTSNTGWETFLEAVISAGFAIVGTWPMRTEMSNRMISSGTNALASSVVLVCKTRIPKSGTISRRHFQRELRDEMPDALEAMIGGESGQTPIAPVDLAQSAIGPGMAIFSKYEAVLNQDGSRMSVHDALILINRSISEYLNPDSGNFDSDTLFCDDWFNQFGWSNGAFGDADLLSKAKGTSVDGIREAGVIESGGGKVRLLKWSEYPGDWDPRTDDRTPVWEACHQMIRALKQQGETAAGSLLARMPEQGEPIRQLAYHLYTLCERKKWAEDARAYNELIGSWHAIVAASHEAGHKDEQIGLEF